MYFTPPQISTNEDLESRSFIYFYFDNKRYKYYNGNALNLALHPNHAKSIKVRKTLLDQLRFEYHKASTNGWNPNENVQKEVIISVEVGLNTVLQYKLNSPYSKLYKRDLNTTCKQFLSFLPADLLSKNIKSIPQILVEQFLHQFKTSGRNYMNKRRSLSIFFSELERKEILDRNPITKTSKRKRVWNGFRMLCSIEREHL